jgi:uracil-DNA glycosylase
MKISQCIRCVKFPCVDVRHDRYIVPEVELDPEKIRVVLISEAAPDSPADYYYAGGEAQFAKTTLLAFNDAGLKVGSIQELVDLGVFLTTAVKCGKTGYSIEPTTVNECSVILEHELAMFTETKAYLLMGDVAIKAVNAIARRNGQMRVIPAGATYKIRGGDFRFNGKPAFPSYLQAGPSFGIEKSKRKMIAEDIAAALKLI